MTPNATAPTLNPLWHWPVDPGVQAGIGATGSALACILFLSPIPTFRQILSGRSTEGFSCDPYISSLCNCGFWVLYAIPTVTPDRTNPLICNTFGLLCNLSYVGIFWTFVTPDNLRRTRILALFTALVLATTCIVVFAIIPEPSEASDAVGYIAMAFNILMYGSPLTIIRKVIETKSVEFMPFYMTLCICLCSCSWVVYGVYVGDTHIMPPNACGVVFGVLQLALYAKYYDPKAKAKAAKDEIPSEVSPLMPSQVHAHEQLATGPRIA